MLPILWVGSAVVIIVAAIRSRHDPRATVMGRRAVSFLFLGAGALVNAFFLLRGDDYAKFADGAYLPFVRDTWRSLVVPNHTAFITALIVFEAAVGLLVLGGPRCRQVAYVGAIGFHIALLSFGWGFFLWSVPMICALTQLLHAERSLGQESGLRPVKAISLV